MLVSNDKKSALLLLSNFAQEQRKVSVIINWEQTGFKPAVAWILTPDLNTPGSPQKLKDMTEFSTLVDDCGVAGVLLTSDELTGEALLQEYDTPYPIADTAELEYKKTVEEQKIKRFSPAKQTQIYLQVTVPNLAVPYEESMWWDLFENAMLLGYFNDEDKFIELGWISRNGLVKEIPDEADYIWPGHSSPWLALHEILPRDSHKLCIKNIHLGEPFYSFISLVLSPSPDTNDKGAYKLRFFNEIDSDRSCFRFNIDMLK